MTNQLTLQTDEGDLRGSVNVFNEVRTRELDMQWGHKISTVPEAEGITQKWWEFTSGVTRDGPAAQVPVGEDIRTDQSGEYTVGAPALAGGGIRLGDTLPQSGAGDDFWTGYTNRLSKVNGDGAGIGVKYFTEGEGDRGGATQAGPQIYSWFKSDVTGVSDKIVPAEHWKHFPLDPDTQTNWDVLRDGLFVRIPHTFYNEGSADIVLGRKSTNGLDLKRVDTFSASGSEMWVHSDLNWATATRGTNITGYFEAAHYYTAQSPPTTRNNGVGRGGGLGGSVTLTADQWYPLISFKIRSGWEHVNISPLNFVFDATDDCYAQITVGSDLDSNANFQPPEDNGGSSEYAVLVDNTATGLNSIGRREFFRFVPGAKNAGSAIKGQLESFSLSTGDNVTMMIKPLNSNTGFSGASFSWGGNF